MKKASVWLRGEGDSPFSAITDGEGHFEIEDVKPGRYHVSLERSGLVAADRRANRFGGKLLVLLPGQEIKDLVLRMQAAAVITGKILDTEGDPLPNISLSVIRYRSSSSRQIPEAVGYGATNDLGEYRIAGLSPGRYLLAAAPPEIQRLRLQPEKKDIPKEKTIYARTYYPGTADKSQAVPLELHAGEEVPIVFGLVTSRVFRISMGGTGRQLP